MSEFKLTDKVELERWLRGAFTPTIYTVGTNVNTKTLTVATIDATNRRDIMGLEREGEYDLVFTWQSMTPKPGQSYFKLNLSYTTPVKANFTLLFKLPKDVGFLRKVLQDKQMLIALKGKKSDSCLSVECANKDLESFLNLYELTSVFAK